MSWVQILPLLLHPHPIHSPRGSNAAARGQTTKVVRCEACGQSYAYTLKRTGRGADSEGNRGVALQRAEENLRWLLWTEIEAIPCPACGRYQSNMIHEARRRYRRWMLYVGQCLTVGLIPVAVCGGLITGFHGPIVLTGLASVFATGIGLLIWKRKLNQSYDPNNDDVEARKRYGQARAILLSKEESEDLLAQAGAYTRLPAPGARAGLVVAILLVAGLVSCGGCLGVHGITRAIVASRFHQNLPAYAALMPVSAPNGVVEPPFPPQPSGIRGKLKGKMVVVNVNDRTMDDLHFALPGDLQASRPEEVATVVLLSWGKMKASGEHPFSVLSVEYQQFVLVKVFDWQSQSEIASRTFFGAFPDSSLRSVEQSVTGPKPDAQELIRFLAGLPRE